MRALLVVGCCLLAPAARAGPWFTAPATSFGVVAGAQLSGLELTPFEGEGFAVAQSAGVIHLYPFTHTLTAGPSFQARLPSTPAATSTPRIAFTDGWFLVVGAGVNLLRGAIGASDFTVVLGNSSGVGLRGVATDPAVPGRVVCTWDLATFENASQSEVAFPANATAANNRTVSAAFVPLSGSLALRNNTALVIGDDSSAAIHVTEDASGATWSSVLTVPPEVDETAVVAANENGIYLLAGRQDTVVLVDDLSPTSTPDASCSLGGGQDFTAISSINADFLLGDSTGLLTRVVNPAGCPLTSLAAEDTGIGGPISAISVRGPREIFVVGERGGEPQIAWRNRPPQPPVVNVGGAMDEGVTRAVSANASDPDITAGAADDPTWAWACDAALAATGTSTATVSVTGPDLCVDPADASVRTPYTCTVVATDTDAQASPSAIVEFAVLPLDSVAPTVNGVIGLQDGAVVQAGTPISLTALATDDNNACLYQADWAVLDSATDTVRDQSLDAAWNTAFNFTAQTLGADAFTDYYLSLSVTDTAGNSGVLSSFTFRVGQPQPPLDVELSCPNTLEAGALGSAIATPSRYSGAVVDYSWALSGAQVADAAPTDATFTFQTDACDGGSRAVVGMVPHGVFEDGARQSCTVELLEPSTPPAPVLSIAEAPELLVLLDERGLLVSLHPSVSACADDDVAVRWDLSALPAVLQPAGLDGAGILALGREEPLELSASAAAFAELQGTTGVVRALAFNQRTALGSDPVEVTLRFAPEPALLAGAGLEVRLLPTALGAIDEGELLDLVGTITTDVGVALPQLTVVLAGDGLSPVPGSVRVTSECGATAEVSYQAKDALLTLEGVSASCRAELFLLARRGLGAGVLSASSCAWGPTQTPLARCQGGVSLHAPAALACSGGSSPPYALVALLLALGMRRRA